MADPRTPLPAGRGGGACDEDNDGVQPGHRRLVQYLLVCGATRPASSDPSAPVATIDDTGVPAVVAAADKFEGAVLARVPKEDLPGMPPDSQLTHFCLPEDLCPKRPDQIPPPSRWSFVLTDEHGNTLHGVCVGFYEPMTSDGGVTLCTPRSLCILSRWPFVEAFGSYLEELLLVGTRPRLSQATRQQQVARCVRTLMSEVPLPPPGYSRVQFSIRDRTLSLERPPEHGLPALVDSTALVLLFRLLSVKNVLKLFGCLVGEAKIVLHAAHAGVLTPVALAMVSLLYPLQWSAVFVPYLPAVFHIRDFVQAPVPFIVGVTSSNFSSVTDRSEVVEVDLNRDRVIIPKSLKKMVQIPKSGFRSLQSQLSSRVKGLCDPKRTLARLSSVHSTVTLKPPVPVAPLQAAFVSFFQQILGDMTPFARDKASPGTEMAAVQGPFDFDSFIGARKKYKTFLKQLAQTQSFNHLVSRLHDLTNESGPDIRYFLRLTGSESGPEAPATNDNKTFVVPGALLDDEADDGDGDGDADTPLDFPLGFPETMAREHASPQATTMLVRQAEAYATLRRQSGAFRTMMRSPDLITRRRGVRLRRQSETPARLALAKAYRARTLGAPLNAELVNRLLRSVMSPDKAGHRIPRRAGRAHAVREEVADVVSPVHVKATPKAAVEPKEELELSPGLALRSALGALERRGTWPHPRQAPGAGAALLGGAVEAAWFGTPTAAAATGGADASAAGSSGRRGSAAGVLEGKGDDGEGTPSTSTKPLESPIDVFATPTPTQVAKLRRRMRGTAPPAGRRRRRLFSPDEVPAVGAGGGGGASAEGGEGEACATGEGAPTYVHAGISQLLAKSSPDSARFSDSESDGASLSPMHTPLPPPRKWAVAHAQGVASRAGAGAGAGAGVGVGAGAGAPVCDAADSRPPTIRESDYFATDDLHLDDSLRCSPTVATISLDEVQRALMSPDVLDHDLVMAFSPAFKDAESASKRGAGPRGGPGAGRMAGVPAASPGYLSLGGVAQAKSTLETMSNTLAAPERVQLLCRLVDAYADVGDVDGACDVLHEAVIAGWVESYDITVERGLPHQDTLRWLLVSHVVRAMAMTNHLPRALQLLEDENELQTACTVPNLAASKPEDGGCEVVEVELAPEDPPVTLQPGPLAIGAFVSEPTPPASGLIPGDSLLRVGDRQVLGLPFPSIAKLLSSAARPVFVAVTRKASAEVTPLEKVSKLEMLAEELGRAGVVIDMTQGSTCPKDTCGVVLTSEQVVKGLSKDPNDYRTTCPLCYSRFVARFEVRCRNKTLFTSPTAGSGHSQPLAAAPQVQALWCEYLSVETLRKEIEVVMVTKGRSSTTLHALRDHSPTLYWNLVLTLSTLAVPCGFLLGDAPTKSTSAGTPPPKRRHRVATPASGRSRRSRRTPGSARSAGTRTKRRHTLGTTPSPIRGVGPSPYHAAAKRTGTREEAGGATTRAKRRKSVALEHPESPAPGATPTPPQSSPLLRQQLETTQRQLADSRREYDTLYSGVVPLVQEALALRSAAGGAGVDASVDSRTHMRASEALEGMKAFRAWADEEARLRRRLADEVQVLKGNIRVLCRVRPMAARERGDAAPPAVVAMGQTRITVGRLARASAAGSRQVAVRSFSFDRVLGERSSQADVFREIAPSVRSVLDGFNFCCMAYGQTGAGKTFTMQGTADEEGQGVSVRALRTLFDDIKARRAHDASSVVEVKMGCFEIYNEKVVDLLSPSRGGASRKVEVRHDGGTVVLSGLHMESIDCAAKALSVMAAGNKRRKTANNRVNENSSRSHAVTMVSVNSYSLSEESSVRTMAKLVLVDLAGSERLSNTGLTASTNSERLREAQHINKSLSALGDVVSALIRRQASSSRGERVHIPFRNSTLTTVLSDCLGGKCKTAMLFAVSPTAKDADESTCTLKFASRVLQVRNGSIDQRVSADGATARRLKRVEMANQKLREQVESAKERERALQEQVAQLNRKCSSLSDQVATLIDEAESMKHATAAAQRKASKKLKSGGSKAAQALRELAQERRQNELLSARIAQLEAASHTRGRAGTSHSTVSAASALSTHSEPTAAAPKRGRGRHSRAGSSEAVLQTTAAPATPQARTLGRVVGLPSPASPDCENPPTPQAPRHMTPSAKRAARLIELTVKADHSGAAPSRTEAASTVAAAATTTPQGVLGRPRSRSGATARSRAAARSTPTRRGRTPGKRRTPGHSARAASRRTPTRRAPTARGDTPGSRSRGRAAARRASGRHVLRSPIRPARPAAAVASPRPAAMPTPAAAPTTPGAADKVVLVESKSVRNSPAPKLALPLSKDKVASRPTVRQAGAENTVAAAVKPPPALKKPRGAWRFMTSLLS